MGVIRVIFYLFLITSLPDTAGGESNPPVKRHHALLPEDTLRCFASGYDVYIIQVCYSRILFTCVSLSLTLLRRLFLLRTSAKCASTLCPRFGVGCSLLSYLSSLLFYLSSFFPIFVG